MIATKGPRNTHVIARNNVPVDDVCDSVAEHKSLEWIMNRFLITEDEVFECLDTYVDLAEKKPYLLKLSCVADTTASNIYGIETSQINDKMYFSILIYGRLFFDIKQLQELFTYSLNLIIVETVLDLKEKIDVDRDCMHGTVLDAFKSSYGEVDDTNIDHILTQLDHQSLMRMMKNDKN
jgi:hypothetical protein